MKNLLGREVPEYIEDYGKVRPYKGAFGSMGEITKCAPKLRSFMPGDEKVLASIDEAIEKTGLKDGMTVSFHHHLRNGDKVVNLVMEAIARKGIKDIHVAASGLFPCHEPLVALMDSGVITKITTSTFNPGPVPKAITAGHMKKPAVLMSHGGRPRAIESGDLHIDVAFIAAPCCDKRGNMNGTKGKSACGYLSYAYADAQYAVGKCYDAGLKEAGVQKNEIRAAEWYARAAAQGHALAMQRLADCYLGGMGVLEDAERGFDLLNQSLAAGNPGALKPLAYCYFYGRGVEPDGEKAIEYSLRACEHGDNCLSFFWVDREEFIFKAEASTPFVKGGMELAARYVCFQMRMYGGRRAQAYCLTNFTYRGRKSMFSCKVLKVFKYFKLFFRELNWSHNTPPSEFGVRETDAMLPLHI